MYKNYLSLKLRTTINTGTPLANKLKLKKCVLLNNIYYSNNK